MTRQQLLDALMVERFSGPVQQPPADAAADAVHQQDQLAGRRRLRELDAEMNPRDGYDRRRQA